MLRYIVSTLALISTAATAAPIVLGPDTIVLRNEVEGTSVAKVIERISTAETKDITIFINSPGGSVVDGYNLIDTIRSFPGNVTCIDSFAASMAFAITQACDTRLVMLSTIMMQHVPSFGTQGQLPNFLSFTDLVVRMTKEMDIMQAKRMGVSLEKFKAIIRDDLWLTGSEAVSSGAADALTEVVCSKEASKTRTRDVFTFFGIPIHVVYSGCPLATAPLEVTIGGNRDFTPDQWSFVQKSLGFKGILTREDIVTINSKVLGGR